MTAADMNVLRRWVADGGCLLAWGDTSIHNEYLESGQGYWLGDVFGVARGRTARRKGLHAPDRSSGLPSFAVGRPLRPVAGGRKTVDAAELTPVGSAKVLLRWSDNTAAMVVNTYGKGTALLANF
ncbi:MAG: hypothetical protein QF792_07165, partial [Phycisphaerae bacterium]|nr:hypothetical protein [Phycisphaerae bacterium]